MNNQVTINGRKYVQVDKDFMGEYLVLKPIDKPSEPEKKIHFLRFGRSSLGVMDLIVQRYDLTPTQAQAIAKAIEALMDFITGEPEVETMITLRADKAREAYQNDA